MSGKSYRNSKECFSMYDSYNGTTRYFPVSASRLEFIDEVDCSPGSKQEH